MASPVRIYVDTNVLLDYVDVSRLNPNSSSLLDQIKSKGELSGCISVFTLMEAVEQRQEHAHIGWLMANGYSHYEIRGQAGQERHLSADECARSFEEVYKVVKGFGHKMNVRTAGGPEFWIEVAKIVGGTNISASDAIHVAIARSSGCEILATSDRALLQEVTANPPLKRSLIPLNCQRARARAEFERALSVAVRRARTRPVPPLKFIYPGRRLRPSVDALMSVLDATSPRSAPPPATAAVVSEPEPSHD
jgi:predicted nucleic acid-binding protein